MTTHLPTQDLEASIAKLIETGRFASKEDILREGVRLIEAQDETWAELDVILLERADDLNENDFVSAEEAFDRLEAKYASMLPKT